MKEAVAEVTTKKRFINVGGGPRATMPGAYSNWECVWLDIDPLVEPDIVCDARELNKLEANQFDAVYCSHNLEHYFRHDALKVLQGFLHILNDDGFAHIIVPDVQEVMRKAVSENLDIGDVLYESELGPIKIRDIIYGLEPQIEQSGNDYYAHKTGFSPKSLLDFMVQAGFYKVYVKDFKEQYEMVAVGFKNEPSDDAKKFWGL